MASFSYGFTLHCKGGRENIQTFLDRAENEVGGEVGGWTETHRLSADSAFFYKEETRGEFYAPFTGLIAEFPDLSFFFALEKSENSFDNSKQCGYAVFENGGLDESAFYAYGHGKKVAARLAEWRGEPFVEETEKPADEPPQEMSDAEFNELVEDYEGHGFDFEDLDDKYKTPRFCLYVAEKDPKMLDFMPEKSKTREVCLAACKKNLNALKFISEALKTPEFYCEVFLADSADMTPAEFSESVSGWVFGKNVPENLKDAVLKLLFADEEIDESNIEASFAYKKQLAKVKNAAISEALLSVPEKFKTPALCLAAVRKHCAALAYAPEHLRTAELCRIAFDRAMEIGSYEQEKVFENIPAPLKTPELCLAAVEKNGKLIEYVPESLKTPELWLVAVKNTPDLLESVPEGMKTGDFYRVGVEKYGWTLRQVPEEFRTAEMCLAAVQGDSDALQYAPENLKTPELCRIAVQNKGEALQYTPDAFKTPELCLLAIESWNFDWDSGVMEYIPESLRTAEVWLAALAKCGRLLEDVPEPARTAELCLAAVQQDGYTLQYVPEDRRTESVCLAAVQQNGYALKYVPEALRTEAVCLAAVQQDSYALEYVPEALRTPALRFAALKTCYKALPEALRTPALHFATLKTYQTIPENAPEDFTSPEFWLAVVQQEDKGDLLKYVPENLKTLELCVTAVQNSGSWTLEYVPEALREQVKQAAGIAD